MQNELDRLAEVAWQAFLTTPSEHAWRNVAKALLEEAAVMAEKITPEVQDHYTAGYVDALADIADDFRSIKENDDG
jgi:hypothetical protein